MDKQYSRDTGYNNPHMSQREIDDRASRELEKFIDKYFNNKMKEKYDYGFHRYYDKATQTKGVDVSIEFNGKVYNTDEKAQLHYVGHPLPTFAFEISMINRAGYLQDGWFLRDDLNTTHYFLVWPNATTDNLAEIKSEDFDRTLCMIIEKQKIIEYMNSRYCTIDKIKARAQNMRENNILEDKDVTAGSFFYLKYTTNLRERPINLVFKREILRYLSSYYFLLSKQNITFYKFNDTEQNPYIIV